MPLDPVTAEIVRCALASAADEMALALYRTAYSTICKKCREHFRIEEARPAAPKLQRPAIQFL